MFFDFTSLSVDGLEMKSLTTSDGVVLFRKSGDLDYIPLQWIESTGGQWCYAANTGDQVQFRCPGIDVKYRVLGVDYGWITERNSIFGAGGS